MEAEMENKAVAELSKSRSRRLQDLWLWARKLSRSNEAAGEEIKKSKEEEENLADEHQSQYVVNRLLFADDFSQIAATWQCTPINATSEFRCLVQITSKVDPSKKILVPRDMLSLACSRPTCQIDFEPNQYGVNYQYYIRFQPNYPTKFTSEDVGDPGRFVDITLLTEGLTIQRAAFNVHYAPERPDNYIELDVSDQMRYQCMESSPSTCPLDQVVAEVQQVTF
eukprot:TRINITY_DN1468_c0_g1_i2.p1 TRINITY_DN1468_c0_g1~~TRINITY_DN1468_c0_g1_i2.p1  ORF type:complete len:250 (-),score=68.01 TRINITY_DN1468_c0_g1_i2:49-720(-)